MHTTYKGHTMLVNELIECLQSMPQDAKVHFAYTANDYWRTPIAPEIDNAEIEIVQYSRQHSTTTIVENNERYSAEFINEQEDLTTPNEMVYEVVVLR